MPRKPRIEYAGAMYHVMSRGDRGEAIFKDDADREMFLNTLEETCGRTGWKAHAYVLMGNHYHMLLETPEANLVAGMKWFLSTYTIRYNARHRQRGHLFQGRYKAVMIDAGEEWFTARVSAYIHLNPLRARLIKWPGEKLGGYKWSSLPAYIGKAESPGWLETRRVYGSVGIERYGRVAERAYARYMEERCRAWSTQAGRKAMNDGWKEIRRGWCMGDGEFREQIIKKVGEKIKSKRPETYGGEEKRAHDEREALIYIRAGLSALGIDQEILLKTKKGDNRKQVMAWWLTRRTCVNAEWISAQLKMGHRTSVSKAVRVVERGAD